MSTTECIKQKMELINKQNSKIPMAKLIKNNRMFKNLPRDILYINDTYIFITSYWIFYFSWVLCFWVVFLLRQ
jgi:ribosomal protein L39E